MFIFFLSIYLVIFCFSVPVPEDEDFVTVKITADRENNIPASSITYTNIPPQRRGGGAEDVLKKGQYR
jgi:hypothetical protein